MAPQKIRALVLQARAYRESSSLLHLFSETHGIIHGIAKGVRGKKTSAPCLERGFQIECMAYIRPHRDLHTLGTVQVTDFFPGIRSDLCKSTMRDAMFELVLRHFPAGAPHEEQYSLLHACCTTMEQTARRDSFPALLWLFYSRFAALSGFGFDTGRCVRCSRALCSDEEATLLFAEGGVLCRQCLRTREHGAQCGADLRKLLADGMRGAPRPEALDSYGPAEKRRITRMLAAWCRYHCEISAEFNSLAFIDELLGEERP